MAAQKQHFYVKVSHQTFWERCRMNTIDWLSRLIAFDTTSRHSNLQLIDALAEHLHTQDLSPWLSHNTDQSKANLFVTIPATNGQTNGGLVLSGHTDVVPVDGQVWNSNPFQAHIADGKLYGRGACDMKGFIAACMNLIPSALQSKLNQPLHLAFSYDEEVGCLGAPVMLDELKARGLSPTQCIVGEPTSMQMVTAHKGIQVYSCKIHGHSAHSSLTPHGVNAIDYAARIIVFLQQLAQKIQQEHAQDAAFDVPFSTINVGRIRGGTAVNIVPSECEVQFDFRNLPTLSADVLETPLKAFLAQLVSEMQAVQINTDIVLTQLAQVPAMQDSHNQALLDLIAQLVDEQQQSKVAYATEGGHFQLTNMQTLICGPGSINQAHKPNEYIELAQLDRCDRFLQQLLHKLSNH